LLIENLSSLQKRFLTAIIFIPPVLASIWVGSPYLDIFVLLILVLMMREWSRMVLHQTVTPVSVVIPFVAIGYLYLDFSVRTIFELLFIGFCLSLYMFIRHHKKIRDFFVHFFGSLYITVSLSFLVYMAHEGMHLYFMWLLAIIWFSDTGAYFAGRLIGGPKLAPSISPNKTWAGFFGGIFAGILGGYLTAPYLQSLYITPLQIITVCAYLSFMGHMGDLLESLLKRHYNVKDTGTLLPGHGGALDRFDSLLMVSFAAGLLIYLGL